MIPVWSIIVASLAFVLVEYYFWVVAPEQRHHPSAAARPAHLLQSLLGSRGRALLPDGRLHQQRRAAPRHEHAFLDVHLLRHAAGIGAVLYFLLRQPRFPAARLRHASCRATSTLSAVQLSAHRKLRQLLPHRARYRPVLHPLRPRAGYTTTRPARLRVMSE